MPAQARAGHHRRRLDQTLRRASRAATPRDGPQTSRVGNAAAGFTATRPRAPGDVRLASRLVRVCVRACERVKDDDLNEIKFKKIWDIIYHIRSLSDAEYNRFVLASKYYLMYLSKLRLLKVKAGDLIRFEKEGFEAQTIEVDSKFNTVAILNLFSILGWGVDALTESLKVPDTRVYSITLREKN